MNLLRVALAGAAVIGVVAGALPPAIAGGTTYVPIIIPTYQGPAAPLQNSGSRSLYLQCDGQPSIMSGTERFARLIGAISLLGLLAKPHEVAEPNARLFAQKGIDACDLLIDDQGPAKQNVESNPLRRVPLLLARAAHQIEAKNYAAAIADVGKARGEAKVAGLIGNPYFDRSMGLSFGTLEAVARFLNGDDAAAREAGLANALTMPASFYPVVTASQSTLVNKDISPSEDAYFANALRVLPRLSLPRISRLMEVGRFAEAADLAEAQLALEDGIDTASRNSELIATAGFASGLAGQWDKAEKRAAEARSNMDALEAAGKPETYKDRVLNILDLYHVLLLAHQGKMDEARRDFATRSQWTFVQGAVMSVSRLLRPGARPDQLTGALAQTADELREANRKTLVAQRLEIFSNNTTLFSYILPYAEINTYEYLSKPVWRTDKQIEPFVMSKEPIEDSKYYGIGFNGIEFNNGELTQPDANMLHAALQAKARGFKGFIHLTFQNRPNLALIHFCNPGPADCPAPYVLEADKVIAELRQVFPSPDELAARRKAAAK